jgi:TRAP-type mannitol/chloroaromatic compound transport system permease small subunit
MRYIFNDPTIWAWDINIQLFTAIVVLGTGNTLLMGGHVSMDLIVSRLSKKTKLVINLGVYIVFLFSMWFVVREVEAYALRSFLIREKASTLWAPPVYPIKVGVFIGIMFLFLQAINLFLKDLMSLITLLNRRGNK